MIVNLTRNTVISKQLVQKNGIEKFIGLIGKKRIEAIVIKTRLGIHTFFLKLSIDLLVIDKNKKVVFLKKDVTPGRIVIWNFKYDTVIELPSGILEKSKTKIGDLLKINL